MRIPTRLKSGHRLTTVGPCSDTNVEETIEDAEDDKAGRISNADPAKSQNGSDYHKRKLRIQWSESVGDQIGHQTTENGSRIYDRQQVRCGGFKGSPPDLKKKTNSLYKDGWFEGVSPLRI